MKTLKILDFDSELGCFGKIIVTGPPRSGTTISALIIASELKYKFIDESFYDGNDSSKFALFFMSPRRLVIHNTSFFKDAPLLSNMYPNVAFVLVKRNISDILDSYRNTLKFDEKAGKNLFTKFDQDAFNVIYKHFNCLECEKSVPEMMYNYFYDHLHLFSQHSVFELNYEDLSNHKLFIQKDIRRKLFKHIKQVNEDPQYLSKKGIMVL